MTTLEQSIHEAAALLRQVKRPCILTGAGVSKESGIPTFRDAMDGLWSQYNPMELASPLAFQRDPRLVWDFYEMRREKMRPAEPNPGHYALAALQQRYASMPLITQNIDDLHERAGSGDIIHLHGVIAQNKCSAACQGEPTLIDIPGLSWNGEKESPRCPHCGAFVRPNVVWFGEILPPAALRAAKDVIHSTDLMLIVGTSGVVSPAAEMPLVAQEHGAKIIEVNPFRSELTDIADVWVEAPSGEALPRIVQMLEAEA